MTRIAKILVAAFFSLLFVSSKAQTANYTYLSPEALQSVNKQLVETVIQKKSNGKISKIHIAETGIISFLQNEKVTRDELAKILDISLPEDKYQLAMFNEIEYVDNKNFITLTFEGEGNAYMEKIALSLKTHPNKYVLDYIIRDEKLILVTVAGVTPYDLKEVVQQMRTEISNDALI
jgi:hypothetical protein